ncbi:hypothetical protein UFOVP71_365 [uncultured Caudovirales phage]|uniref:Uncharacterized protein n=1 Tax=uncultured Caudovirales phage TaxID=2100421 RepID=A0A6J5TD30_9CAUD|nr:hypothetical protein UFOVP71_365 [uncultured Caudovirales phage]
MKFFKEIKEAYGQRDAYQRDYDSSVSNMGRPEDHRGLRQELAHETNNLQVSINGRPWKVFAGKGTADSPEERNYLRGMQAWAEKKSAATGKKWTVGLTGAEVTEGQGQAQLKKVKNQYNQAAKDSRDDQAGYGKKIDDTKKGLRARSVKEDELLENEDDSPMYGAIIHRIMVAHPDLLSKYGPEKIMMAAQEEAEWVGDVEEIGSSDVSISVKRVMQALQEQNPTESIIEAEGEEEGLPHITRALLKDILDQVETEGPHAIAKSVEWGDGAAEELTDFIVGKLRELSTSDEVTEMDSQGYKGTRDDSEDDAGKKAYYGKVAKPGDVVKKGVDALQNAFNYKKDDWSDEFERRMKKGVTEGENPEDVITVDVPLFIRLMEYAREDAKTDMDLHDVAENATRLSADGSTLTMKNYESIIPSKDVEAPAEEPQQVEEATGHQGYDNMLKVLQAVEAGQDAHFDLAGEPITLEYPEARFLGGKYKAFLRAGRQEEFLKYMNDPAMFDRLMLQLRQLIDKQKNFKGSVPGERDVQEAVAETLPMSDAVKVLKHYGADHFKTTSNELHFYKNGRPLSVDLVMNSDATRSVSLSSLNSATRSLKGVAKQFTETADNEYYCKVDRKVKAIPEGYKKLASGYITRK